MTTLGALELDKNLDTADLERACRDLWERSGIHRFDPDGPGDVFSVDTPPPYVSAAHLHVGHAMSYTQAEIAVRYQRMRGRRVYYPMGFDDNGLPTERYVEQTHGLDKRTASRADFRALCLEETRRGAAVYEELWRALGLSVDWSLRYSTIDDRCQHAAQRSFIDLFAQGRIARSEEPVLWDPVLQTALAQAELSPVERRAQLHELAFTADDGTELPISTTRPELLAGCVALYAHTGDARYAHLAGHTARVPLLGHAVPIRFDDEVRADFGTGLMMVCTFGDADDVRRWKRDRLDTRVVLRPDGTMAEGVPGAGLPATAARKRVLKALEAEGLLRGRTTVKQVVATSERSGAPVELRMLPQWSLRILDLKDELLARARALSWHPEWMRARLEAWIEGLSWDWTLSRQRFYGVPFPVWLCADCGGAVCAEAEALPIDPLSDPPPVPDCPACGGALAGDPDVMDTWMTSSMTPLIHAGWADGGGGPYPLTLRVQAFEIIRTWLFSTLLKAHLHTDALPFRDVMISGWGLNEQGRKISKRDLSRHTDEHGYNRYDPARVIERFGADALRHWAARTQLGGDARYSERAVRAGRKVVVKLWNAARFARLHLHDFDPEAPRPAVAARAPEDRWALCALAEAARTAREGLERYDYAVGLRALDRFFWTFCDDYLELAKDRLTTDRWTPAQRLAAQATLWEALRVLLGLYAPYLPFVTEGLWQRLYASREDAVSLHVTRYPEPPAEWDTEVPGMAVVGALLGGIRAERTAHRIPQTRPLLELTLDLEHASEAEARAVRALLDTIRAGARAAEVRFGPASADVADLGVRIGLRPAPRAP